MPIHVFVYAAAGAIAAGVGGASWLAERRVKKVNAEIVALEASAAQKNQQYGAQRQHWCHEFGTRLAAVTDAYKSFLAVHALDETDVNAWAPEPWLQSRIGELTIRRPLLIEPKFDMPAGMHQMQGYRMVQVGHNLARSNPAVGQTLQGAGFVLSTGAYIKQELKTITDSDAYIASATVYIAALQKTIAGFDARFKSEVEDDLRSVERLSDLLADLQTERTSDALAHTQCLGIVYRTLINFLQNLVVKYS